MLASSAASSSPVATSRPVVAESAANATSVGAVPLTTAPLSETDTCTVSAWSVSPVRLSVNAAAVPSVTGVDAAAIDTTGSTAAVLFVTSVAAMSATGFPAASRSPGSGADGAV